MKTAKILGAEKTEHYYNDSDKALQASTHVPSGAVRCGAFVNVLVVAAAAAAVADEDDAVSEKTIWKLAWQEFLNFNWKRFQS